MPGPDAFDCIRHADKRGNAEAGSQNRGMACGAAGFHHDADDIQIVTFPQLQHVRRPELIGNQNDGIFNLFGLKKACGGAAAGEDALNALEHVGDVFNAVSQVLVVDLFKIAPDLLEAKRKRPFGINKFFTDKRSGFRDKRRILQDCPVDIQKSRSFRRSIFVEVCPKSLELFYGRSRRHPEALDLAADIGLINRELRNFQVARHELNAAAPGNTRAYGKSSKNAFFFLLRNLFRSVFFFFVRGSRDFNFFFGAHSSSLKRNYSSSPKRSRKRSAMVCTASFSSGPSAAIFTTLPHGSAIVINPRMDLASTVCFSWVIVMVLRKRLAVFARRADGRA